MDEKLASENHCFWPSVSSFVAIGERNREAPWVSLLARVFKWEGRLGEAEKLGRQAVDILQATGETNARGQAREQDLADILITEGQSRRKEERAGRI